MKASVERVTDVGECLRWTGIELKLTGKLTAMPAGLICASVSVHAAKEKKFKEQLMKPEKLPIYTPPPLQSNYVEEKFTNRFCFHLHCWPAQGCLCL